MHPYDKQHGESVRPYSRADLPGLLQLMIELQGHIASLDPLRRQKTVEDFDAGKYIDHLCEKLEKEEGILFVMEENGKLLGFIAGSIPGETEEDLLDHYPTKEGIVHELVVSKDAQGKNIGRQLLQELERYFGEKGCISVRVGCFTPNIAAHAFYEKCGYSDRHVEMLKTL